jgi:hypothetical protein
LLSPEVGFDALHSHEKESKEEDKIAKNMEQKIECPRCNDIMTLSNYPNVAKVTTWFSKNEYLVLKTCRENSHVL